MERLTRWLVLITLTCAVLVLTAMLVAAVFPTAAQRPHPKDRNQGPVDPAVPLNLTLEPELAKALAMAQPDERLDIIIEMREQVEAHTLAAQRATDASARMHMVDVMQSTAQRTQAVVRAYLAARRVTGDVTSITPFWIFNGLAVKGARPEVIQDLAARADVGLIRLDHWRRWIEEEPGSRLSALRSQAPSVEWGVSRIRAAEVWNSLGVDGEGVVVASVDTGVDWQHAALQSTYRGYDPKGFHQHAGNWYDATGEGALYPVDSEGHGSHTMGTLVGQDGIGVAPGAQWIAVRAFNSGGLAYDSWLHAAFEWLLAPNGDPNLAPQIVSNSWGNSLSGLTTFQRDIDALRAAGIFTLFAAGNLGPSGGSVASPASLPGAFAVGASDPDDEVASFSGRGPSPWREVRPHVVAPGVNVRSTLPGDAYGEKQGTSMATPHVAGTAALMLSVRPELTITQTAHLLTRTAVPLTSVIPNNNSGYGRIDAYAAVALAADAGLISGTVTGAGLPLRGAVVEATPAVEGLGGSATSDDDGHFQIFLGSGYYHVTASAFGHVLQRAEALSVTTGATTVHDFRLAPLPTGQVRGSVKTLNGDKVEATIRVLGTPATTTAAGGDYQLELPGGQYTLEARALGYRIATESVTVQAGEVTTLDLVLLDSMRILLVDSGSWYYGSQVEFFRQALDDLAYTYDEHRVKHLPPDTPTITDLLSYELVIWTSPLDSPGVVGAGEAIYEYLERGGNILVSGQDVAFWDGGGSRDLQPYYFDLLNSLFLEDDAPSRHVICSDDSALGGIDFTVQGGDGADNQRWPDEIGVLDPDHASLACTYEGGRGAAIQAGFCSEHRALNLGFGLESISNGADRAQVMARALDWFASPRRTSGVELSGQSNAIQVAPPGGVVTHTFRLRNMAEVGARDPFQVEIGGHEWPVTVLTSTVTLSPCESAHLAVRVEIPPEANWNDFDDMTVTARSSAAPAVRQTLTVTSKTPAPVLLVDDDRWIDQEQVYADALRGSGMSYDRWEVTGYFGEGSPPREMMSWYPVILWFTGYDWYDPLHPSEVQGLVEYLEGGGRLFLSSQSVLGYVGNSELVQDYFGVISYSHTLSQTAVAGVPGHVLGDGLGPVDLIYPFRNWSDSLLPAPGTQVAFRSQHGQPGAVTRESRCSDAYPGCRWRTAFFVFPFEALPEAVRSPLMSRLVGWLSWLGRSELVADRASVQVGDTVGYALTLRNDGPTPVAGVTVSNTLPTGSALVEGPYGGASYDPLTRRITWSGELPRDASTTFTYRLKLMSDDGDGLVKNSADIVLGEQDLAFERQSMLRMAAPDLSSSTLTLQPGAAGASSQVTATLVVRNVGIVDAGEASVNHPLPWPLRLVTGTLSAEGGGTATEWLWENRIEWRGRAAVGAPVTLTYRATAPSIVKEDLWLYDAARLEDGVGGAWERGGWLYVAPHRRYMPIWFKNK
jgi:uncharacterized repeat protein (TIGR01451 family)